MAAEHAHYTQTDTILHFGAYQLDLQNEQLLCGEQAIRLTGKAFAVLAYLVRHPHQLVSKDDLFYAVWPHTVVSDSALTTCIKELRKALQDRAKAPQYIETVHRRGFRFIAALSTPEAAVPSGLPQLHDQPVSASTSPISSSVRRIVGREVELGQLHVWLNKAQTGTRQIVFITGEPGIGKTALVDTFLSQVAGQEAIQIGRGQCIEQHGAGEAYLPILEALGRLCRGPQADHMIALLRQNAPTWLAQMLTVLPPEEREPLQREVQGVTRERMLRELAEALEVLSAETPLLLVLEDLHWSDASTLGLLASLARRPEAARLMVIGTYRPTEMLSTNHPLCGLVQELSGHRQCEELSLSRLSTEEVNGYLTQRFPTSTFPLGLAQVLHERTGGNPLFLVNTVEDLIAGELLAETRGSWSLRASLVDLPLNIPESLRRLIAKQMEGVENSERQVLAAGSIAGREFSIAAVAAALDTDMVEIEARSERLARHEVFLQRAGFAEWPDRTHATRYRFLHAFYQELWHEQVPVSQRQQWHLRIGERLEEAYREHAQEVAAELALRFDQAGHPERAIPYLRQAGENALNQNAYTEAILHFTQGLSTLKTLPDGAEQLEQELGLQLLLGPALLLTKGSAASDVELAYRRVRELCQQTGETPRLFPALVGLFLFYGYRAECHTMRALAEQLLRIAEGADDPMLQVWGHVAIGSTLAVIGEFLIARQHLEHGMALAIAQQPNQQRAAPLGMGSHSLQLIGGEVQGLNMTVFTLWHLGYADQAVRGMQLSTTLAQGQAHPFSLATASNAAAHLYLALRQPEMGLAHAEECIRLSTENGFQDVLIRAIFYRGWALALQGDTDEGLGQMRECIAAKQAAGVRALLPDFLAFLAEIYLCLRRSDEGLEAISSAFELMRETGERHHEAELYRVKGELLLLNDERRMMNDEWQTESGKEGGPATEAEACFQQALAIARRQEAKLFELRAAMSLSRLWQQQGRQQQAYQLLSEAYHWFTEGFDTADLQDAKALLVALA